MDRDAQLVKAKSVSRAKRERFMSHVFFATAATSVLAVALICAFLLLGGIPAMREIGLIRFLTGTKWRPNNNLFGILPMILGSIYITLGAIIFGVPTGILVAVFLAKYCPGKIYRPLKMATELLAGIPSVVYGLFGLVVLVPLLRNFLRTMGWGNSGNTILTASVLLGIMILPTIIGVTESAIRAVPAYYYEGALALGATHERSIFVVVLPAAKSGIMAGVVLGIGRAIGETMAVIMVAGNQARMPASIFQGVRTLTANIVMEMGYATDLHREALIATAVVLFVFVLLINLCIAVLRRRTTHG